MLIIHPVFHCYWGHLCNFHSVVLYLYSVCLSTFLSDSSIGGAFIPLYSTWGGILYFSVFQRGLWHHVEWNGKKKPYTTSDKTSDWTIIHILENVTVSNNEYTLSYNILFISNAGRGLLVWQHVLVANIKLHYTNLLSSYDPEQFAGAHTPILVIGTKLDQAQAVREIVLKRSSNIAEECGADEINLVRIKKQKQLS